MCVSKRRWVRLCSWNDNNIVVMVIWSSVADMNKRFEWISARIKSGLIENVMNINYKVV